MDAAVPSQGLGHSKFLMRLKNLPGSGNAQLVINGATRSALFATLGKTEDQAKAIWVRQVFTGGGSQPLEVADSAAAKKALSNAIAIVDAKDVDATVKVIGSP